MTKKKSSIASDPNLPLSQGGPGIILFTHPVVLRLTAVCEKPTPGDVLLDARDVYGVTEDMVDTERFGEVQAATLHFRHGQKVTVFDKDRDVKLYWMKALGLSVCPREDNEAS